MTDKTIHSVELQLTDQQRKDLENFIHTHKTLGTAEVKVDVVGGKISPASIQVGTAK